MGTRNVTMVISDGKTKVAQYAQWDGYPTGQGKTIVKFLSDNQNIKNLKNSLKKTRFLDEEGKDKEFYDEYLKNAPELSSSPDNRTEKQKRWFDLYITGNLGAEILFNIANSIDDEIILKDSQDFKNDELFCEYYYTLNLDDNTVSMNGGKKYQLDKWTDELMEIFGNKED